ncbi:MAG: 7-carboxy-7-deazaguanine synthase [Candidatus Neomarinimicrobiota bacterium]|nr:MAG: 7-carboxy-7-deazaguanine synthase [Candidatus Neomarinimicrobiota bacterium]
MALCLNEIFYSIQGESTYAGRPCVFVRLAGCNLRCSFCDTKYAYDNAVKIKIEKIIEQVSCYACSLVEITGGEPLLQKDTPLLIFSLLENGHQVLMETNGSFDISLVDRRCIKIVDIKCPVSGQSDQMDLDNLQRLGNHDQLKFVISDRKDYAYAKNIIKLLNQDFPPGNILFSPVFGTIPPLKLAGWILADNLNVRLQLQLHKFIWPDRLKGV